MEARKQTIGREKMKKLLLIFIVLIAGYKFLFNQDSQSLNAAQPSATVRSIDNEDSLISNAYANHKSDIQVSGKGIVIKILPDDNQGSKHQKLVIKLASGQTVLIAHNIDLAPRVSSIRKGDMIQFYGEYEWNEKGGVIHWTHHDPNGSHVAGWLKHNGKTYQ